MGIGEAQPVIKIGVTKAQGSIGGELPTKLMSVRFLARASAPNVSRVEKCSSGGPGSEIRMLQNLYTERRETVQFTPTSSIEPADSIPQVNEGVEIFSRAITPISDSSTVEIEGQVFFGEESCHHRLELDQFFQMILH